MPRSDFTEAYFFKYSVDNKLTALSTAIRKSLPDAEANAKKFFDAKAEKRDAKPATKKETATKDQPKISSANILMSHSDAANLSKPAPKQTLTSKLQPKKADVKAPSSDFSSDSDEHSTVKPAAVPMVKPVAALMVKPVAAPMVKPVAALMVKPVAAPMVKPVAALMVKPVAAPMVKPVAALMVKPVAAPMVKPVAAPMVKPVAAPIVCAKKSSIEVPTNDSSSDSGAPVPVKSVVSKKTPGTKERSKMVPADSEDSAKPAKIMKKSQQHQDANGHPQSMPCPKKQRPVTAGRPDPLAPQQNSPQRIQSRPKEDRLALIKARLRDILASPLKYSCK